eukprot:Opistho-2@76877
MAAVYTPPSQVKVVECTPQVAELFTIIRDKRTSRGDFIFYSDRLIRLVVEEGLNELPYVEKAVVTPTGAEYKGVDFTTRLCGVSIMRAGEAMERGLRDCCRSVRIGKILIQRDESTKQPQLYYAKLPQDINTRYVMIMDPLLATGGTVCKAIEVILDHGVPEKNILFVSLIAAADGINLLVTRFPEVTIVVGQIDGGLDSEKYIVPGIGDFGERYFGTDDAQ